MYARRTFKVRFRPELAPRFFEEAEKLHKQGFVVDTMLPATLSVFGSFDSRTCDWRLRIVFESPEIAEWKVDLA